MYKIEVTPQLKKKTTRRHRDIAIKTNPPDRSTILLVAQYFWHFRNATPSSGVKFALSSLRGATPSSAVKLVCGRADSNDADTHK